MLNIRVGGVPEHFNYPWHLGSVHDAWQRNGLAVDWTDYAGGTGAMVAAMERDELDVATVLTDGAVHALAAGLDATVVAGYVSSPLTWGIHLRVDDPAPSVRRLADCTFGISRFGSGSHLMAFVLARKLGWNPDALKLRVVGDLEGARNAMVRRQIDAFLWEKYTTKYLVDAGEWRRLDTVKTPWPAFVLLASGSFLRRHAPRLGALLEPVDRVVKAGFTDHDFVARRYGLAPDDVKRWAIETRWSLHQDLAPILAHTESILQDAGTIPPSRAARARGANVGETSLARVATV